MTKSLLLFLTFFLIQSSFTQESRRDKGNVNIHLGTILIYSTYSLGYEGFDLLKNEKHSIRPAIGIGGWNANVFERNTGVQSNIGFTYSLGKKSHLLDVGSAVVFHFDKSLKGNGLTFIAATYRPYLGYRFQPVDKKLILKIGFGWREVLQVGVGWRL